LILYETLMRSCGQLHWDLKLLHN